LADFSAVFLTAPGAYRKTDPEAVRAAFLRPDSPPPRWFDDTADALEATLAHARAHKLPVLAIGSFYLAAEIKSLLKG
jgi:folylpolyglutamate synthase/dihydropteroate synthase